MAPVGEGKGGGREREAEGVGGRGSSFALLNPPCARLGNEAFKEEKRAFPSEKCARRDKKFVPSEQYSSAPLNNFSACAHNHAAALISHAVHLGPW